MQIIFLPQTIVRTWYNIFMKVRIYNSESDYSQVRKLYELPNSFGGDFDNARDAKERIDILTVSKPECVLVAEDEGVVVGTVTLFEDGRSAWLYRFAVQNENEQEIALALWMEAKKVMKEKGHSQVLVYAPAGNIDFEKRYANLGFNNGGDYTAYWQDLN